MLRRLDDTDKGLIVIFGTAGLVLVGHVIFFLGVWISALQCGSQGHEFHATYTEYHWKCETDADWRDHVDYAWRTYKKKG